MKPTHMLALVLVPVLTVACAALAAWFRRARDVFFIAMVGLTVFVEKMQVNFFSEGWYRGSTRGVQFTLVEILAFGLLVGCVVGRHGSGRREAERRIYWPGSLGFLLLFIAYAIVSVVTSEPKIYGAFELTRIFASLLIFLATAFYVRTTRECMQLVATLACSVGFEGIWAVRQHFMMGLDRAAGTLDHANSLSMYFCLAVPTLVAIAASDWTRWLKLLCGACSVLGAIGLLLTLSRAGLPVFAVTSLGAFVACASWRMTPMRVLTRTLVIAGAALLLSANWDGIQRRWAESSLEEEYFDTDVDGRGVYLRLSDAIVKDHFFGVGLNNWSYEVSRTYGARLGYQFDNYDNLLMIYSPDDAKAFANAYLAAPAHNLGALTLGELGVPGFVIFGLLWLRWFGMGIPFLRLPRTEPMRALGVGLLFSVCGIFGQSLTEWVYRQTPILFTFYILVGALASLAHARRRAADRLRALEASSAAPAPKPAISPVAAGV
jgi:hypothetical protein